MREAFGSDADDVIELLARYGADPKHRAVDRVQRDVVALSGTDINLVGRYVEAALADCQDFLMLAEEPQHQSEPSSYEDLRARLRDRLGGAPPVD